MSLGTRSATVPNPGFGPPLAAAPDPETLERIARCPMAGLSRPRTTKLSAIYKALGSQLGTKKEQHEITAGFALMGFGLLLGGAIASVRWSAGCPNSRKEDVMTRRIDRRPALATLAR